MELYLTYLTADDETDYPLWKATNLIKMPIMPFPPIRKGQGDWARENKQKADLFPEYLEDVFTQNDLQNNNNLEEIDNIITEEITPVTPKEVAEEIESNLNPKEARYLDLIKF